MGGFPFSLLYKSIALQFLFSPPGAKYRLNFKFAEELKCGQPAPRYRISNGITESYARR